QLSPLFLVSAVARQWPLCSLDIARHIRVLLDHRVSLSHQRRALLPESHLLLPSRSRKVREPLLPDFPSQFSVNFCSGESSGFGGCMAVAEAAFVDRAGLVALAAEGTSRSVVFFCRRRENRSSMAAW